MMRRRSGPGRWRDRIQTSTSSNLLRKALERRAAADDDSRVAPMELTTKEKNRMPTNMMAMATRRSVVVAAVMSPYPTVVRVVTAK